MLRRFYCPNLTQNRQVSLETREAHHAYSVLRYRAGDRIELFDGKGSQAEARITRITKKELEAERGECEKKQRFKLAIHLAQAVPHRKKLDDIVEKCEELAVSNIILLKTARTVFDFIPETFQKMLKRLELEILEGAKQSRNNYLMEVEGWKTILELIKLFPGYDRVFLMSPEAQFQADPFDGLKIETATEENPIKVLVLIGPEGGFSPEEEEQFREAGSSALSLGDILLKCDTAAVAAVSLLKFAFESKLHGN